MSKTQEIEYEEVLCCDICMSVIKAVIDCPSCHIKCVEIQNSSNSSEIWPDDIITCTGCQAKFLVKEKGLTLKAERIS